MTNIYQRIDALKEQYPYNFEIIETEKDSFSIIFKDLRGFDELRELVHTYDLILENRRFLNGSESSTCRAKTI